MKKTILYLSFIIVLSSLVYASGEDDSRLVVRFNFSEGSGNTLIDSIGSFNGTPNLGGSFAWSTDTPNAWTDYSINTTLRNIKLVGMDFENYDTPTISLWFKVNNTRTPAHLASCTETAGDSTFWMYTKYPGVGFQIIYPTGTSEPRNLESYVAPHLRNNTWHHFVMAYNSTNKGRVWIDGKPIWNSTTGTGNAFLNTRTNLSFGGWPLSNNANVPGLMSDIAFFNKVLLDNEVEDLYDGSFWGYSGGSPLISSLNCTSCNIPNGDITSPYETEDTTPTFKFTTDKNAWCAIGVTDVNYTTMGASRNCTSGEGGTQGHICTLKTQDRFANVGANYLYISCKDSSGNEGNVSDHSKSNSGSIKMEIQGASEDKGDSAIQLGITTSEIGATATIYSSQRVSARNLATNQFTGIFDKVAVNGNKRWAFNYVSSGESQITGLFNLTPILYVLQLQNQTNTTITDQVGKLINSTYP